MEDTIVQQNHAIMSLQEELEAKIQNIDVLEEELEKRNRNIFSLEENLKEFNASVNLLQGDLNEKNKSIKLLQDDLNEKNKSIKLLQDEILKKNILSEEVEKLTQLTKSLNKKISSLEEDLVEKNEIIKRSNLWHCEIKKEFEALEASSIQKENELKRQHEKEIENLKQDFIEQFKLFNEKKTLLEAFLESQVYILLNKAEEFSHKSVNEQEEILSYRRIYEEELKSIKLTVNKFSDKSDSQVFKRHIEDLSTKLVAPFLHQDAIKNELENKIKELNDIQNELTHFKRVCDDVMTNEKQLFTKLTQTEMELNLLKDEKSQLQQHLLEANNNYEKVTIDFNRDRIELDKKYRQVSETFETELVILNKSLQELLGAIPSNFDFDSCLSGSGDSSLASVSSDTISQFSNPNILNAQKIINKCLSELRKFCNESKKINQENRALKLAIDVKNKTYEEKVTQLKKLTDDFSVLRCKCTNLEEEKKYLENKLKYMTEESHSLNVNNQFLNSQLSDLNDELKNYKEEVNSLKKTISDMRNTKENCEKCLKPNLQTSFDQGSRLHVESDSVLVQKAGFHISEISYESLPGNISRDVVVYTSTPFREADCDPQAGGEFEHQKAQPIIQNSIFKWMDQCQKLHKENNSLKNKIADLELLNQDLKFCLESVKEEMSIFEKKQSSMEKKLNNFVSLRKQYIGTCDDVVLKDIKIKELLKEVNTLKSKNTELFNKNLELEEVSRKTVLELTEIKHSQNISLFTDTLTNAFNEKVTEIIDLKKEIQSLKDEKNCLQQNGDLLFESNSACIVQLNSMIEALCLCEEELEKEINEKIDLECNNKLLNKEVQLLQVRVNYLSTLRDTHWCNPSSVKLMEELQDEVLNLYRLSVELRLEAASSAKSTSGVKDNEKVDPLDLPEILKLLTVQLREEQLDLEGKITEFHRLSSSLQENKTIDDSWFVKVDKILRSIKEEMKYHREQHFRIEEALRSTGKLHDELQKQKDALRIKDYELDSIQKKFDEEKIKSRKSEGHLKMLEKEIMEKNDHIAALIEQKDKIENELIKLKKDMVILEMKHEGNKKAMVWKCKLDALQKTKGEIDNKINSINNAKFECECKESLAKGLEDAEISYRKALDDVKALFQAELSSTMLQIQEVHKEQVEKLNCIISEQAVRIGFLLKKGASSGEKSTDMDTSLVNQDMRKQFELAVYGLQELHQEEMQLLKLQLEAAKYKEVNRSTNKITNIINVTCEEDIGKEFYYKSSNVKKSLSLQLASVLKTNFITQLKTFLFGWHTVYTEVIPVIEEKIINEIERNSNIDENLGKLNDDNENVEHCFEEFFKNLKCANKFLNDAKHLQSQISAEVESFAKTYTDITMECFEKVKQSYSPSSENLQYKEDYFALLEEKEHLEKQYKNAVDLLHNDHKADEDKLNLILNEIKHCCENGCDPNTLLKIQDELEEKHKKELEDLRAYYVQMCANMEKQYSEDVNSLHSRMLSLSSSCSDEILSDEMLFDKGVLGDQPPEIYLSDILLEDVVPLEKLSPEQLKLVEKLNQKWSEDIKQMKKELEKKYTNKIEQLQDRISTFIYNNELEVSVRCLKDEVMRDCSKEIKKLEDDISKNAQPYRNSAESEKFDDKFSDRISDICKCSCHLSDSLSEQLMADVIGNVSTSISPNKVTKGLILNGLKSTLNLQEDNLMKVAELFYQMNHTFSLVESKVKEKESQLLCLQNKLNNFSQVIINFTNKCKHYDVKSKIETEILENSDRVEKMLVNDIDEDLLPPEWVKICNVFKNKLKQLVAAEKEHCKTEIECLKESFKKEMSQLECGQGLNLSHGRHNEEVDKLIKERDCLKQMTLTLKSAVSQLVSYLNTCEDELNRTVVDELLKICDETPKKGGYPDLNNTLSFKRVHFAPEVEISDLEESADLSSVLRLQLDSCLSKLKLEAASLLGLTALQPPPANLNKQIENLHKENEELLEEISQLKQRLERKHSEALELKDQLFSDTIKENGSTILQDKVQHMLTSGEKILPESVKLLEDLAKFGDQLINELQVERMDLQQQIEAADKQLKSTRKFLEEQAVERESERDEYSKQVSDLEKQLKEFGKNRTSHHNITSQVVELEAELSETSKLLAETRKKKDMLEEELKDAIDKIWVLRDIISGLEAELKTKSDKEEALEKKLDELENELDQQSGTQFAMAQELESLRSQSMDEGYLEQIKQLQENIKVQFNSSVVRQMKSHLQDISKAIEQRTKELEALYLSSSCMSLSSPSEEVSLREQLELSRSKTPEQCPSPVNLPVEEITRLQEKIARHARAEEVLIKRFRDIQITSAKLTSELEDMNGEREIMQLQLKKQKVQLAESKNKIDDLRHKVETAQAAANKDLIAQVQELKENYSLAEQALDSSQNQLDELKGQLLHAEETISKQQFEIRSLAECDSDVVDSLRLELAAVTAERNKLQEELDKSKREFNLDIMGALLSDKNEDIDHLQETVSILKRQGSEDKGSSCNSKGFRVSFATEVEESSNISEDMKLRDAPGSNSLEIMAEDIREFEKSNNSEESDQISLSPSQKNDILSPIFAQQISTQQENNESLLKDLQSQLLEKSNEIISLQSEVQYLKSIEIDLTNTKSELENVLKSISEDKQFYENELQSLKDNISNKDKEIIKLKNVIISKDTELIKTTADVQALREISFNLQDKLKEATKFVENENASLKEELSQLTIEANNRDKQIDALRKELFAHQNDLSDEKELSKTLKSSLNLATQEKMKIEETLDKLKVEYSNLVNALHSAEDNFREYVSDVVKLKNEIIAANKYFTSNDQVEESLKDLCFEKRTLQEFRLYLINLSTFYEKIHEERESLLKEVDHLKLKLTENINISKDFTINKLQEESKELKAHVLAIREEKLQVFSKYSSEINELHKDIYILQKAKEVLMEKLDKELIEKETLKSTLETIKTELNAEREHFKSMKQSVASKLEKLSSCGINILEIPPVSYVPGLDALTEKMRNEIHLSATLDNSLLDSILPDNNAFRNDNNSEPGATDSQDHEGCCFKVQSLEKALIEEVENGRDVKRTLRAKENQCRDLETGHCQLRLQNDRLERLLSSQNEKINHLIAQTEAQKEKIITLELSLLKEQACAKQISDCLEEERKKGRQSQKEDIALIETMRKRLQILMENEIKLKNMVIEERQKSESLLAQLNSIKAMEKYRSDSDDETRKNVKKMILHEREKYLALKVEYEKERRTCEDLREVLNRERKALNLQREHLSKTDSIRKELENEVSALTKRLNEENLKRQIAEIKNLKIQQSADDRLQKERQTSENKNKKSLDAAYSVIRDLEKECHELKRYVQLQEEGDEDWKRNIHVPLIQQLNEVNGKLDELITERIDLKRTIDRLEEENSHLRSHITQLRLANVESECNAARNILTCNLRHLDSAAPLIEIELTGLMKRALQAECRYKALMFQKRYLLISLQAYKRAHAETALCLLGQFRLRTKRRFRSVALAVIAVFKIRSLPLKRVLRYNKKKENLLQTLSIKLFQSTERPREVHSPPSRDRPHLR